MSQNPRSWLKRSPIYFRLFLTKLFPRLYGHLAGIRLYTFNGVKIYLDFAEATHRTVFIYNGFEPEMTRVLHSAFHPGDVFVDIGANIGWHTLNALVKCPNLRRVYAFEPQKNPFGLLKKGMLSNRVQDRCQAQQIGLSDQPGNATIKLFPDFGSMHSSLYQLGDWPFREEQIQLSTLDEQAEEFVAPPAIVKCDVEGNELKVMVGAQKVMSGHFGPPPMWFLEVNYETSAMADFFPWQMIDVAAEYAPYQGYHIRGGQIKTLSHSKSLRHSETLILAIPDMHADRLGM